MMKFEGFNWDIGNEKKCEKHGLSKVEIEEFFSRKLFVAPDIKNSISEERFLAIGQNAEKRPMIVIFTFREINGAKLIRPISARYMHEKEVRKYEKTFKKNKN